MNKKNGHSDRYNLTFGNFGRDDTKNIMNKNIPNKRGKTKILVFEFDEKFIIRNNIDKKIDKKPMSGQKTK